MGAGASGQDTHLLHHRHLWLLSSPSALADAGGLLHRGCSTSVAVCGKRLCKLLLGAISQETLAALLQLPSLSPMSQANLKTDLVPHTKWLGRVALLIAPPSKHTGHARRSEVLDMRKSGACSRSAGHEPQAAKEKRHDRWFHRRSLLSVTRRAWRRVDHRGFGLEGPQNHFGVKP